VRWPWQPKSEDSIEEEAPFVADAPIRSATEDTLGRTEFAKNLAEIIAKWRGDTSLVIAIRSPWGNGKTSVKNLILEQLGKASPRVTTTIFNRQFER
jgi:predicted KAP-like P-loop ATPase